MTGSIAQEWLCLETKGHALALNIIYKQRVHSIQVVEGKGTSIGGPRVCKKDEVAVDCYEMFPKLAA